MKTILQDKIFIKHLMEYRDRTIYVRVTALDLNSNIKDIIMGQATEGSINVDGASAVRRSCSLTLITENLSINNYNWALNTRFRLEIGIKNNTSQYTNYDIVWFPQGDYVITQFSASFGTNSCTISLSGQDKMCLMNGEISGLVNAETDFGSYDEVGEDGKIVTKQLTLREIILALVHTYGFEPLDNIIIELPDDNGYNLLTYRGDNPLYLLRPTNTEDIANFTFYGNTPNDACTASLKTLGNYWKPKGINQGEGENNKGAEFTLGGTNYYVQKIEYGETAGYEQTELTYAGELKAAAGEAVTSILDKIKNMLGEFEYFYDVYGVFHFQKKKTYLKTHINGQSAIEAFTAGEYSYEFDDLSMFTSFNNNPNIKNLKNDFTVWGEYKSASGAALPIHMRLAIDKKPSRYCSPWQKKTYSTTGGDAVDWRELIYQMALDYQANHINPNYSELLEAANPGMVSNGRTGYEQYYTDVLGFWHYLYEPNQEIAIKEYARVSFNDATVNKYWYPWKIYENPDITDKDYPYSSLYVRNGGYYTVWTDAIDLTPSDYPMYYVSANTVEFSERESRVSLRKLYRFNSATDSYSKVLDNPILEQPYYIYERNSDGSRAHMGMKPVNLAESITWGIMDNLENLYLKQANITDNNDLIPLLQKIGPKQIKSAAYKKGFYRKGIYVCLNGETTTNIYDCMFYYDKNNNALHYREDIDLTADAGEEDWEFIRDAFTKGQAIYFRPKEGHDIKYNPTTMSTYLIGRYQMNSEEASKYSLYYKYKGKLKLYAQHLMDDGLFTKIADNNYKYQVIDEVWLANLVYDKNTKTTVLRDLIQNINVDRNNLYRKNNEDKFIPAFEYQELLDEFSETNELYVKNRGLVQIAEHDIITQYEEYKSTKLNGTINEAAPIQKRLVEYFTPTSDYNLVTHWNRLVDEAPQQLLFWFDFLDPEEYPQLAPYSVQNVGTRPMVKTEKTVTAIYYPDIPSLYFGSEFPLQDGTKEYFTISSQGQSAHDTIDSWLYNHTYITESVSITTIPIYGLEPNSKILVDDDNHGIHGDYIIDKLTIPLSYSRTMSITATKAPETF